MRLSHRRTSRFWRNPGAATAPSIQPPSSMQSHRRSLALSTRRSRIESAWAFSAGGIAMDAAEILDPLTHAAGLPKAALHAATAQRAEMVPVFLQEIDSY